MRASEYLGTLCYSLSNETNHKVIPDALRRVLRYGYGTRKPVIVNSKYGYGGDRYTVHAACIGGYLALGHMRLGHETWGMSPPASRYRLRDQFSSVFFRIFCKDGCDRGTTRGARSNGHENASSSCSWRRWYDTPSRSRNKERGTRISLKPQMCPLMRFRTMRHTCGYKFSFLPGSHSNLAPEVSAEPIGVLLLSAVDHGTHSEASAQKHRVDLHCGAARRSFEDTPSVEGERPARHDAILKNDPGGLYHHVQQGNTPFDITKSRKRLGFTNESIFVSFQGIRGSIRGRWTGDGPQGDVEAVNTRLSSSKAARRAELCTCGVDSEIRESPGGLADRGFLSKVLSNPRGVSEGRLPSSIRNSLIQGPRRQGALFGAGFPAWRLSSHRRREAQLYPMISLKLISVSELLLQEFYPNFVFDLPTDNHGSYSGNRLVLYLNGGRTCPEPSCITQRPKSNAPREPGRWSSKPGLVERREDVELIIGNKKGGCRMTC
ncbi:hypothetical protein FB451DRAFT_1364401, partial [Mycena latifolia]